MARGDGKSAVEVDFASFEQAQAWFERQPREVCVALAVRWALHLLPLIEAVRDTQDFAPRIALPVFRACFVTWAIAKYPSCRDDLQMVVNAANAATADARTDYPDGNMAAAIGAALNAAYTATGIATNAVAAAATNATYAATKAYGAISIRADAVAIEQGRSVAEIVNAPLWPGEVPEPIAEAWDRLRTWMLEDEADSWDPWVEWYERVRDGRPSFGEGFDLAVASLTAQQWNEEPRPAAVNHDIAALLAEHTPVIDIPPKIDEKDLPEQTPRAPIFQPNQSGVIDLALQQQLIASPILPKCGTCTTRPGRSSAS